MFASLFLVLCALSGCAMVGPKSISMGRADYNDAINKTEDEQMLLTIVKGRYGETSSLLAVTGVAANVRFGSRAGAQVGIGPSNSYAGNLVPFSAGLAYEENPTITYSPVQGEKYLRQLLSPIALDILGLIIRATDSQAAYLTMLANRINDLRNPDFLEKPSAEPDLRFQRFVELNRELDQACVLQWVEDPKKEVPFNILITGYAPAHAGKVLEYLKLLGLSMPSDESKNIIIPVYPSIKGRDGVAISTRSTFDLIQILQAAIEIPEEHVVAGLTHHSPTPGLAGKDIHIHASKGKPEGATVSVKYRGYWYYIDQTDMHTKLSYHMVRILWSVTIAAATNRRAVPILTIPVGR